MEQNELKNPNRKKGAVKVPPEQKFSRNVESNWRRCEKHNIVHQLVNGTRKKENSVKVTLFPLVARSNALDV